MEGVDAADVSDAEAVCYCVFYDLSEIILRDRYLADMIFKAYHTITPLYVLRHTAAILIIISQFSAIYNRKPKIFIKFKKQLSP